MLNSKCRKKEHIQGIDHGILQKQQKLECHDNDKFVVAVASAW